MVEIKDSYGANPKLLGVKGRFSLWSLPPVDCGHRECDSYLLLCFTDHEEAASSSKGNGRASLKRACKKAVAAVADPDLGLGDFGIDVYGEAAAIPPGVMHRIKSSTGFVMAPRGVVPPKLDDDALEWMARVPPPAPERIPRAMQHPDYIRVSSGGVPIGVFHRNGMSWNNALVALIRSGIVGGKEMDEGAATKLASLYEVFAVHQDIGLDEIPQKAPRRKTGTAPTSSYTRERYHGLLDAIGAGLEQYPLPEFDREARKLVEELSSTYRRMKASGSLPATRGQMHYASRLARDLGIDLPSGDRIPSRVELGQFIEDALNRLRESSTFRPHESDRGGH